MIVSPKQFQAITNRQNSSNHNCCLTINNADIKSKESVTLLGVGTDNKLNFEKHVFAITVRPSSPLSPSPLFEGGD